MTLAVTDGRALPAKFDDIELRFIARRRELHAERLWSGAEGEGELIAVRPAAIRLWLLVIDVERTEIGEALVALVIEAAPGALRAAQLLQHPARAVVAHLALEPAIDNERGEAAGLDGAALPIAGHVEAGEGLRLPGQQRFEHGQIGGRAAAPCLVERLFARRVIVLHPRAVGGGDDLVELAVCESGQRAGG